MNIVIRDEVPEIPSGTRQRARCHSKELSENSKGAKLQRTGAKPERMLLSVLLTSLRPQPVRVGLAELQATEAAC